ncbi:hypothetical protein HA402_015030 [Bradysia odoriphaga]|nr:hypothetical protein HA402_015030 [Bradysia odoriphaga]
MEIENVSSQGVILAIALTCVAAKPSGLVYTAPSLYSAPLAAAPLAAAPLAAAPLTSTYYNAPLTYSAQSYRPLATYASPYAYSAYNTYNYRAPYSYSAIPSATFF